MARPREFDENDALDRALAAFWARGYDATSIDDLIAATGVGRASLYGAFGDKERLFRRVMDRYLQKDEQEMAAATRDLSGEAAVRALFAQRLKKFCPRDGLRGCFLQISGTSGSSAQIIEEVGLNAARDIHERIVSQLKVAQAKGDLAADADVTAVAAFLLVLLNGLSSSARAGMPTKALKSAAEEGLDRVFSRAAARRAG
jgi:AcrR family transcriptional regulator